MGCRGHHVLRRVFQLGAVVVAAVSAPASGFVPGCAGACTSGTAQAQSLGDYINQFANGNLPRQGRSQRPSRKKTEVIVPPVPTKQQRPWHVQTQRYPSTGPEPDWPKVLDKAPPTTSRTVGITPPPAAKPKRGLVAAPQSKGVTDPNAKTHSVDQYTPAQVHTARARCRRILGRINAVTMAEAPIKKGPCGDAAPVKLISLGKSPQVAVVPPAIVNCDMVEALHTWLTQDLQPLARKHLKSPIVKIENMSSYSCRNAYGRVNTRLSEHARANALDIRGFVTSKGKVARLLTHWGPTGRDIKAFQIAQDKAAAKRRAAIAEAEAAKQAAAQSVAAARAAGHTADLPRADGQGMAAAGAAPPIRRSTLMDGLGEALRRGPDGGALTLVPDKLGGPAPAKPKGVGDASRLVHRAAAPVEPKPAWSSQATFLKKAHERACKLFGTTLGPEANNAHRNHFHVDLAPRKRSNYCE